MRISLPLFLLLAPIFCFSQADEINITASFRSVIDIRIVGSSDVYFEFNSIHDYTNGLDEFRDNYVQFEVASTTNFHLHFNHSAFMNERGNILDPRYFYFRLRYLSVMRYEGSRFVYGEGDGLPDGDASLSNVFIMDNTIKSLLEPGSYGNRGYYDKNYYEMQFGCGTYPIRALSGLPNLLDANIAPGTYTSVLTLTALPVIQ